MLRYCFAKQVSLDSLFDVLFKEEEIGAMGVQRNVYAWLYVSILHPLTQKVTAGCSKCLHLGCQRGSCVCVECMAEWEKVRGNSTLSQSETAWIRFTSVCSAAVQKYGRNLRTVGYPMNELNRRAAPKRQIQTNNQRHRKTNTKRVYLKLKHVFVGSFFLSLVGYYSFTSIRYCIMSTSVNAHPSWMTRRTTGHRNSLP